MCVWVGARVCTCVLARDVCVCVWGGVCAVSYFSIFSILPGGGCVIEPRDGYCVSLEGSFAVKQQK